MRKSFVCRASCLAIKGFHKAASLEKWMAWNISSTLLMKDSKICWNVRWQISFFFAIQLMKDLKQFLDIRWQQIFAPNLTFPKIVLPNWPQGEPCFILTHTQGTLFYTSNYRHALKDTAQLDNDTLTHWEQFTAH